MTIICTIILLITWSFQFLNAIRISIVPGHYINWKMQYSTARTAVSEKEKEKDTEKREKQINGKGM